MPKEEDTYMTNARIRKRVLANVGRITLCVMVLLALNGCALRMGNKIVAGDRFDYSGAIARSWKEQMLLNMVKLRYGDNWRDMLLSTVERGRPDRGMPSWKGTLSDETIAKISVFLEHVQQ